MSTSKSCLISLFILLTTCFSGAPIQEKAFACSCVWEGAFMNVVHKAPLVVRAKILRHNIPMDAKSFDPQASTPSMDALALEVLKGAMLDSGLRIQLGDGMHCRPNVETFPVGSEWILAINGAGAKPGTGLAISHCGEYWLKVENNQVIGSIDGNQGDVKRMKYEDFRARLRYPAFKEQFKGKIKAGERYSHPFGRMFELVLEPMGQGWMLFVKEYGRDEDLARLTPSLHFMPNPREIEGWHFLKDPTTCPDRAYLAESGPDNPRKFIFSPEVGKTIQGPNATTAITVEEVDKVSKFGKGTLDIKKHVLTPDAPCPDIEWMEFVVNVEGGC